MTPALEKHLEALAECALGPWEPLSKAFGVADGLANRLARTSVLRNSDPMQARDHLIAAFKTWPILCRVMADLEAAYPQHAAAGAAEARPILDGLDQRDGRGDYA